jgi:predicted enzyme related to lactoylglutathione lyase
MTIVALLAALLTQDPAAPPLRVSMISLGVKDMARSVQFYGETLGMQMSGQPGEVTLFQAGDFRIALNRPLGNAASTSGKLAGAVEVIFSVESVATAYRQMVDRGCRFMREPREVTAGTWAATFTDPDGHRLTILGPH